MSQSLRVISLLPTDASSFRPFSVQHIMKAKLSEDGREASTHRRMMMENGHPGVEVDDAAIRRGENPYTKYYQQQGEQQLPSDTQVCQQYTHLSVYLMTVCPR